MSGETRLDNSSGRREERAPKLDAGPGLPSIDLEAFARAPFSLVITNPNLEDNPIVFVNSAFEEVTGYTSAAAIGRNCRFLQGEGTRESSLDRLRDAIDKHREVTVDITNYRADGESFRNRLMISPMLDENGEVVYFMGVQMRLDTTDEFPDEAQSALAEIQHRVKNHLSMIVGLIRMQAKGSKAQDDFTILSRRVEVLQLLYEQLSSGGASKDRNDDTIPLGAYLSRIANAIAYLDGRRGVRVTIDAEPLQVPFETATHLGLILSELMTNAMQHAFKGRDDGLVRVEIAMLSGNVLRVSVIDDGVGMPEGMNWPDDGSLGGRIVKQLIGGLNARFSLVDGLTGTTAVLDVPAKATRLDG